VALPDGREGVTVTVEDTGQGMPRELRERIFEPFFTTKQAGTGLGLFVSQRIVQAHGGTIDVTSEEGIGTCFRIRLPVYHPAEPLIGGSAGGARIISSS
jgi:signal transduction histidine kinase